MSLFGPISTLRRHRDAAFEADFLAGALPGGMSFSRPSAASHWDSAGVHRVAANNEPRFDYDPMTGRPRGLLLEPASTNYFTWSNDFTVGAWTFAGATRTPGFTAPNGKPEAVVFTGTSNGPSMRSWSIPQAGRAAFSVYVNPMGNTQTRPFLIRNGTTATNLSQGIFDPATGTIATSVGDGAWRADRLPNGWWRICASANAAFAVGDTAVFYFGFTTGSISNMPPMACWGGQAELGDMVTSLIPTTNAIAARARDTGTLPIPWYSQAAGGTFLLDAELGAYSSTAGGTKNFLIVNDGGTSNRVALSMNQAANTASTAITVGGAETVMTRAMSGLVRADQRMLFAVSLGAAGASGAFNGAALAPDVTTSVLPIGMDRMLVNTGGAMSFSLRTLRYYTGRPDLAQLTAR